MKRRSLNAALLAAPFIWTGARARPVPALRPTPSQTEGTFYPVELPADHDFDLLRNGSSRYPLGTPARVEGSVLGVDGKPVTGAQVKVRLGTHDLLTTQLYVEGDPGNAGDFLWRRLDDHGRAALTRPFVRDIDGLRALSAHRARLSRGWSRALAPGADDVVARCSDNPCKAGEAEQATGIRLHTCRRIADKRSNTVSAT